MTHYSKKESLFPMQGGCPCGHIRYQLTLPPLLVHCCHCTSCQRQTGSVFSINAIVESSAVSLLPSSSPTAPISKTDAADTSSSSSPPSSSSSSSSVPLGLFPAYARLTNATHVPTPDEATTPEPLFITVPTESTVGQTIAHCPVCHAGLWSYYADAGPAITYIRVGTLDRAWELEPDAHIFTRSRRDFVTLEDGKPQFEGYYQPDRNVFYRSDTSARVEELKKQQDAWKTQLMTALT